MKSILTICLLVCLATANATTWDEPWQDKIVKQAQSFILTKVLSTDTKKGLTVKLLKQIQGTAVADTIYINGFSLLRLCSISGGEGPEFHFSGVDSCYFFVSKNDSGYSIATPTSGFAVVSGGVVSATFRHSYHQAALAVDVYEKTMTAVFNHYHNLPYDEAYINKFIDDQLSKNVAGFEENEILTFFNQHAALELVYHLGLTGRYSQLLPFLHSNNFHAQVSAARALIWYNTADTHKELMAVITDTTARDFLKVIAIWTLKDQQAKDVKEQVSKLQSTASENGDGFGGNIMDPRVCTHLPSVKNAMKDFIDSVK